ncbi:TPA: transposase, partial [Serratia marcescens]|nr:transposase [Serratia marcescens]
RNTCSAGQKTSYRQKKMVRESVNLYNAQRPHLSLKYKTPDEVHRALSG